MRCLIHSNADKTRMNERCRCIVGWGLGRTGGRGGRGRSMTWIAAIISTSNFDKNKYTVVCLSPNSIRPRSFWAFGKATTTTTISTLLNSLVRSVHGASLALLIFVALTQVKYCTRNKVRRSLLGQRGRRRSLRRLGRKHPPPRLVLMGLVAGWQLTSIE